MRVYQAELSMSAAIGDGGPTYIADGYLGAFPLVENRTVVPPIVTNFRGGKGLGLYAKNLTTLIDGLAACSKLKNTLLDGQICIWVGRVGDSKNHRNITMRFLGAQVSGIANRVKAVPVFATGYTQSTSNIIRNKLAQVQREKEIEQGISGAQHKPGRGLSVAHKVADKIGFNMHQYRDGDSYSSVASIQRQDNMAKGRAVVFLFPARYRPSFDSKDAIAMVDNGKQTLATIGVLVRSMKGKIGGNDLRSLGDMDQI